MSDATQWTHGPWTHSQAFVIYSLWPKWSKTQYDFGQIYIYNFAKRETTAISENEPNVSTPWFWLYLETIFFFSYSTEKKLSIQYNHSNYFSHAGLIPLTTHDNIHMMRNDLRPLLLKSTLDNASEYSDVIWYLTQSCCRDRTAHTKDLDHSCGGV